MHNGRHYVCMGNLLYGNTSYYEEYLALVLRASRLAKSWEKFLLVHGKLMKWKMQNHSKTNLLAWGCINRLRAGQGNAPEKEME